MSVFTRYRQWAVSLALSAGYFALWLLLSGSQGWLTGLIVSLVAAVLALRLGSTGLRLNQPALKMSSTGPRLNLWALPSLLTFFLLNLLSGAWAVARITLRKDCAAQSQWASYRFTSRDPGLQLLLSAMTGLLPGTLSTQVQDGAMQLHLLDGRVDWEQTINRLEQRLMNLLPARH